MISKRILLYICLVGIGLFFLAASSESIGLCPSYSYSSCAEFFNGIAETLLLIFPLFLLLLITYKMRDEVYRAWLRFSYVWIPLSMILVLLSPEYSGGYMPLYSITKSSVAFLSSLLFVIISLILIAWKYFTTRNGDSHH